MAHRAESVPACLQAWRLLTKSLETCRLSLPAPYQPPPTSPHNGKMCNILIGTLGNSTYAQYNSVNFWGYNKRDFQGTWDTDLLGYGPAAGCTNALHRTWTVVNVTMVIARSKAVYLILASISSAVIATSAVGPHNPRLWLPAVIAVGPLLFRAKNPWTCLASGMLIGLFASLTAFSVGMFYAPAAFLMLIASAILIATRVGTSA